MVVCSIKHVRVMCQVRTPGVVMCVLCAVTCACHHSLALLVDT